MTRCLPIVLAALALLAAPGCVARGPVAPAADPATAPIRNPAHLSGNPAHSDPGVPRPGMQPPGVGVTPALIGP